MKKGIAITLLLALLLTLYGCGETQSAGDATDVTEISEDVSKPNTAEDTEASSLHSGDVEVKTYPLPEENVWVSGGNYTLCPASQGGYYYGSGKYLRYQTLEAKASTALCAQSGCKHVDPTCQAYMGGMIQQMAEYRGTLYAIVTDDTETPSLVSHPASVGDYQTLLTWGPRVEEKDGKVIQTTVNLCTLAHGKLYYNLWRSSYDLESGEPFPEEVTYVEYDLSTGNLREIPIKEMLCAGKAGIVTRLLEKDYDRDIVLLSQIRLYDPETWDYTVVADYERDGYIYTGDPAYHYGGLVPFQCGNTMYVFDADTGETQELLTSQEPIINYWMLDHKVFYITQTEDDVVRIYYVDIADGIPVQLENKGNTESMVCSIISEGRDYFTSSNHGILSKEDFYNENYD